MALTVGGEETAESKNLSANETYQGRRKAPTRRQRTAAKYYSAEDRILRRFPAEIHAAIEPCPFRERRKDCTPDENGVYHAYVGGGSNTLPP